MSVAARVPVRGAVALSSAQGRPQTEVLRLRIPSPSPPLDVRPGAGAPQHDSYVREDEDEPAAAEAAATEPPHPRATNTDVTDSEVPPPGDTEVALSLLLVQRAQAGDAAAFGALYDRYVGMVYRYVSYRVASRQLAEDLTSETFLRALRRLGSFEWQGRDVGAWFVTIARNLVADHYKSARYRLELTTDDVCASGPVPVEEGPERQVLAGLQSDVLLAAVRRLGPEQQECIALRFLQGMSVAETAQVMGKNDGAVKALQHRAVRALGRLLPPDTGR